MKKIQIYLLHAFLICLVAYSCENVNDLHRPYMENGEIDYIGRIDSMSTHGGRGRIEFRCYLADSRATSLNISWQQGENDSTVTVQIPEHNAEESFSFILGNEEAPISENSHTFTFISNNEAGITSIPYRKFGNIYGEKYRSTLADRQIVNFTIEENNFSAQFSPPVNHTDKGIILTYTDTEGQTHKMTYSDDELVNQVTLQNVNFENTISYQTRYLPEENALDTFYTNIYTPAIEKNVNIAIGKPATCSDQLNDSYGAQNAVDAIATNASRWINAKTAGLHWIEIDLEREYPINSIVIKDDTPIADFTIKAEVDGQWVDVVNVTNNTTKNYTAVIDNVNMTKVRYEFTSPDDNPNLLCRMFEFEVYSKATIQ